MSFEAQIFNFEDVDLSVLLLLLVLLVWYLVLILKSVYSMKMACR